jgi:hypothetical protein
MNLRSADNSKSRFAAYVEKLVGVIGHADRAGPLSCEMQPVRERFVFLTT